MLLYYIDGMGGCSAVRGGAKSLLSRAAGVELSDPTCAHLGIVRAGIDMHTFRDCQGLILKSLQTKILLPATSSILFNRSNSCHGAASPVW
jgi:hypothetical protein